MFGGTFRRAGDEPQQRRPLPAPPMNRWEGGGEGGGGATAAVAEGEGATEGMGLIRRVGYFLCL